MRHVSVRAIVMMALFILPATAAAQPPTYLPWQAGVTYRVTQGNNGGYSHNTVYTRYGWDFGLPFGAPVLASAPGTVRGAVSGCVQGNYSCNQGWGNAVLVCYGDGTCSRYAHLSAVAVSVGQAVGQAQLIGRVGSTGNSSGAHLHYQLENGSQASLASHFVEAGVPVTGQSVTSANQPGGGTYKAAVDAAFPMDGDGVVRVAQDEGYKVQIGFNLRNAGTATWGDVRLVLLNDPPENMRRAAGWETTTQIPGNLQRVAPGEATYVRFHVNPQEINPPDDYPFRFRLYDRATGTWIEGPEPSFVLRVDPGCLAAHFVGQQPAGTVLGGTTRPLEIALHNAGYCTWQRSEVRLGTAADEPFPFADGSWYSPNRIAMAEESVGPGETAHFRADVAVPEGATRRLIQRFAPVDDGQRWFGQHLGLYQVVLAGESAIADDFQAEFVDARYPEPLTPGETGSLAVTYRNVGWASWLPDGNHPVHFRASRPQDRESRFVDSSAPDTVGSQGVRLAKAVHPGQTVTITVPIRIPEDTPPGEYHEYFRLVAEGTGWFGPDDNWWPIQVH